MSLSVAHMNVRSLRAHYLGVRNTILHNNYDVVALSETWLTDDLPSDLFAVPGYNLYRNDRQSRGGGVAFYIRSGVRVNVCRAYTDEFIEYLWICMLGYGRKVHFGVFYRPECNFIRFLEEFEETLSEYNTAGDFVVCLGDFNIDMLSLRGSTSGRILDLLHALDMTQLIDRPTRVTLTSATLLDLLIVANGLPVQKSGTFDMCFSDHSGIYCKINMRINRKVTREFFTRTYKHFNYDNFVSDLYGVPWFLIYDLPSVDLKVGFFNSNILNIFNKHAPVVRVRTSRPPTPWLTYNIRQMMKARNDALMRFRRTREPSHHLYYKSVKNEVNRAIKREKQAYFGHLCASGTNTHNLWREFKKLNPGKKNCDDIPEYLKDVNRLNVHFSNPVVNPIDSFCSCDGAGAFEFQPLTEEDVLRAFRQIKTNACGMDSIDTNMIRIFLPLLMDYVLHIFNFCVEQSVFPEQWRSSLVRPIAKTKSVEALTDLRPISLLPVLSKVFERCLESQLRRYVTDTHGLPEFQSGFRSGYSCTTALAHIIDDVLRAIDDGYVTILVLLDFSKAFDTVNHGILLTVLKSKGLSGGALRLLRSYLSDRTQRVEIDGCFSDPAVIRSGVPQGAILSPLLFSIYTSNLPNAIRHSRYHLYADDTQLYLAFKPSECMRAQQQLNEDLESISEYCGDHQLYLNPTKTQAIVFGPKRARMLARSLDICVGGTRVVFSECVKSLGLCIDDNLRFSQNTACLVRKAVLSLKSIYACRQLFSSSVRSVLCNALVLSHFNYGDVIYGSCITGVDSARIQRVQNSCVRLIYGIRGRRGVTRRLCTSNILNMRSRRSLHCSMFFMNIFRHKKPYYLYNKIKFRYQQHTRNVRYRYMLTIPRHTSEIFKRSYSYNIAKVLNVILMSSLDMYASKYVITNHIKKTLLEKQWV